MNILDENIVAYCVLRIAYSPKGHPKHNIISVIFNDTVQGNISRGLAESMIMANVSSYATKIAICNTSHSISK